MEIRMRSGSYTLHVGRNVDAVVIVNGSREIHRRGLPRGSAGRCARLQFRERGMLGDMAMRRARRMRVCAADTGFDQAHHKGVGGAPSSQCIVIGASLAVDQIKVSMACSVCCES